MYTVTEVDGVIYTVKNDSDATLEDEAAAVEAYLIDKGYTQVEIKAAGGKVTSAVASKGSLTTEFLVNKVADDDTQNVMPAATSAELKSIIEGLSADGNKVDTVVLGAGNYSLAEIDIADNLEIIGVPGETVIKTTKTGNGWGLHIS